MRHARSLKDRRSELTGIRQKLTNRGFSVTEIPGENPKEGALAFCVVGHAHGLLKDHLYEAKKLFVGNFEVADIKLDIMDYSFEAENPDYFDEKFGYDDEDD